MPEITVHRRQQLPPVDKVVIEFTGEEAQYLFDLCGGVGGAPTGPRGIFRAIRDQLREVGYARLDMTDRGAYSFPDNHYARQKGS